MVYFFKVQHWIFMKDNLLLSLLIVPILSFISHPALGYTNSNWTPLFIIGDGITRADQNQTLRLNNTPAPGLTNRYVGSSTLYGSALFALAFEKELTASFSGFMINLGFEIDYMRNHSISGTVQPMVNVAPDFDRLRYVYDIQTILLQAYGKLIKKNLIGCLDGYLQAGLGTAANELYDYREYSPANSSAAPMLAPFQNKNTLNPALSVGIGVSYAVSNCSRVSFGYRYFYSGEGKFGKSAVQQTNASFKLSSISFHFLIMGLSLG